MSGPQNFEPSNIKKASLKSGHWLLSMYHPRPWGQTAQLTVQSSNAASGTGGLPCFGNSTSQPWALQPLHRRVMSGKGEGRTFPCQGLVVRHTFLGPLCVTVSHSVLSTSQWHICPIFWMSTLRPGEGIRIHKLA